MRCFDGLRSIRACLDRRFSFPESVGGDGVLLVMIWVMALEKKSSYCYATTSEHKSSMYA